MIGAGPAGMESDLSDSEYYMGYDDLSAGKRKPAPISVPISKEEYEASQHQSVQKNGVSKRPDGARHHKNNYKDYKDRNLRNDRLVSQNSLALDDLRYAIMQGRMEIVKDFIEKGIWVDSILKSGWSGLMYAASFAQHEIVLYLLENNADPNYHNSMFTPLMAACASIQNEADLYKCCCHLLKHGARVNEHERHMTTSLMFAARGGYFQIVKELLKASAEVNVCDNKGQTALFCAASGGYGQIVHLLLTQGANPKLVDCVGQTAADLAKLNGHIEVSEVLNNSALQYSEAKIEDIDTVQITSAVPMPRSNQSTSKNLYIKCAAKSNDRYVKVEGELELFFNGIGLPDLISVFKEQHLTFSDLLVMSEEELENVGIGQIGIRKKILDASKAVHKKQWQNSSLPNLKQSQYISCPDAVAMMANIAKHLKYISTTVVYVRQQIQSQPRILELAQDIANVHDLLDEMDDSLKNVNHLNDELRFFKLHLNKVQDDVKFIPADVIIETVPNSNYAIKRTIVFGVIAFSVTVGGILWKKPGMFTDMTSLVLSKLSELRNR